MRSLVVVKIKLRQKSGLVGVQILNFLKFFVCTALVHIPKEKRSKLEGKSIECIMMGYSTESKAYKLFNPEDYGILISRDVVFLEESKIRLKRKTDFYYSELV